MSASRPPVDVPQETSVESTKLGTFTVVRITTGEPWRENCYVVIHDPSRAALIVDPGDRPDEIVAVVRSRQAAVTAVLLTHAHHDHVGAVVPVCRELGVKSTIHSDDRPQLRYAPLYAYRFAQKVIEPVRDADVFTDSRMTLGGESFSVRHTPGHTPGGVAIVFEEFAFTGDTLLFQHVGRTDLPGGDAVALKASVDELLSWLPPSTTLFPGHGRSWTAAEAGAWWRRSSDAPPVLREHGAL